MNNIFEQLFQYGFHDTEISSIDGDGLEVKLTFDNGIYLLDESGKETTLSKPMRVVLKINSSFDSFVEAFEIREYGRKIKYLDYSVFEKYLQKNAFGISMAYFSKFNNCILFDGGFYNKQIMLSIEGIDEIVIREKTKDASAS